MVNGIKLQFLVNFNIEFNHTEIRNLKTKFSNYYQASYKTLLDEIVRGSILHIDETPFNVEHRKGYVWTFTNMETVYYLGSAEKVRAKVKIVI